MKVITTIGKHCRAVIVGRGANFILPSEGTFRVRVLADLGIRAKKEGTMSSVVITRSAPELLRYWL